MVLSLIGMPAASAKGMHEMDVDKKVESLKTKLTLTDTQASQVKAILNEYKVKMEALMKEKHEKMDAILTPEQRTKHAAMMKEWKDKKEHGHDKDADGDND
jgi:Spy/CpxP family protein refolding chaperone